VPGPPAGQDGAALRVVQVRSAIGAKPKHRGTLRALGLRRVGQANVLPDRAEVRGMISRVAHLVRVEACSGPARAASTRADRAGKTGGQEAGKEAGD
jgi:large subunit ribosomal protein L30